MRENEPSKESASSGQRSPPPLPDADEDAGLVFKTVENAAQPSTVAAETNDGLLSDAAVAAINDVIGELTSGYEKKIADLQTQVAELRGQVTALLSLLQGKAADVVVLPKKSHA